MAKKLRELEKEYNNQSMLRRLKIKLEPNKFKRFFKWIWYLISFPWIWCWYNFRDWRTFVLFLGVMAVVGCEVWVPLLLGIIFQNKWLLGIAGACEAFWMLPGTPFIILCILITMLIKPYISKLIIVIKLRRKIRK